MRNIVILTRVVQQTRRALSTHLSTMQCQIRTNLNAPQRILTITSCGPRTSTRETPQVLKMHTFVQQGAKKQLVIGFGEVVHFVDTCSTGAGTGVGYTRALENLRRGTLMQQPERLYDVQTYHRCNKHLRIRVAKAVGGQMMLKIVARSYNTAVDEGDPEEGYTYWTSKNIMFSVEAQVKPLTGALLSGLGVPSTGQVVVNEADSLKFFMVSQCSGFSICSPANCCPH